MLSEEIKDTKSSKVKDSIRNYLDEFLEKSESPLIVYCFDNSKLCDAIIGGYLSRHYNCNIKTTTDIVRNLTSKIQNTIILDVGVIPFHLLVFDKDLGYFLVYRNKVIGSYFNESDDLKPLVLSISEKIERINRMKN